jgi:hypothetical protein
MAAVVNVRVDGPTGVAPAIVAPADPRITNKTYSNSRILTPFSNAFDRVTFSQTAGLTKVYRVRIVRTTTYIGRLALCRARATQSLLMQHSRVA